MEIRKGPGSAGKGMLSWILLLSLTPMMQEGQADERATAIQKDMERKKLEQIRQEGSGSPRNEQPAPDWDKIFQKTPGGAPVDDLRLFLASPPILASGYESHPLYLGLESLSDKEREIQALPSCGNTLGRCEGIELKVRDETGAEVAVKNGFMDQENVHPHPPLAIAAQGRLMAALDLIGLSHTSGALSDFLKTGARRKGTLTVTVSIPALKLESNPVEIRFGERWAEMPQPAMRKEPAATPEEMEREKLRRTELERKAK